MYRWVIRDWPWCQCHGQHRDQSEPVHFLLFRRGGNGTFPPLLVVGAFLLGDFTNIFPLPYFSFWRHQATVPTNVDLSLMELHCTLLRTISQEMLMISIFEMILKNYTCRNTSTSPWIQRVNFNYGKYLALTNEICLRPTNIGGHIIFRVSHKQQSRWHGMAFPLIIPTQMIICLLPNDAARETIYSYVSRTTDVQ